MHYIVYKNIQVHNLLVRIYNIPICLYALIHILSSVYIRKENSNGKTTNQSCNGVMNYKA